MFFLLGSSVLMGVEGVVIGDGVVLYPQSTVSAGSHCKVLSLK